MSHPMWVRGLKHKIQLHLVTLVLSHPMWVRGLKLITKIIIVGKIIRRTPCGCVD